MVTQERLLVSLLFLLHINDTFSNHYLCIPFYLQMTKILCNFFIRDHKITLDNKKNDLLSLDSWRTAWSMKSSTHKGSIAAHFYRNPRSRPRSHPFPSYSSTSVCITPARQTSQNTPSFTQQKPGDLLGWCLEILKPWNEKC